MSNTKTNRPDYWNGYKAGHENLLYNPPALETGYDGADWPVIEYNDGYCDGCDARDDEQDHPKYKNLPAAPSLDDYDEYSDAASPLYDGAGNTSYLNEVYNRPYEFNYDGAGNNW